MTAPSKLSEGQTPPRGQNGSLIRSQGSTTTSNSDFFFDLSVSEQWCVKEVEEALHWKTLRSDNGTCGESQVPYTGSGSEEHLIFR